MRRRAAFLPIVALAACSMQRSSPTSFALKSTATPAVLGADDHMSHMSAADLRAPVVSTTGQQGVPGLPPSASSAEARLKASPRHAEWMKIAWEKGSSDSLMAYVVYPTSKAKAPVVVVVHEIFGLQTWVRGVADQVAADGFIAIAPDMLSKVRGGPSTVELPGDTARAMISRVNTAERNRAITAAANYAMMLPSARQKYSVIGYCWGGQTVFAHAVNQGVKGYSGGVAFYGAFPYMKGGSPATATTAAVPATVDADSIAKIKAPVMLLNGSKDGRIGAMMPTIDSLMKRGGKKYSATNYEGAVHGFLRAQDDPRATRDQAEEAANLAATKDGWPKTIAFLKKNMGVK